MYWDLYPKFWSSDPIKKENNQVASVRNLKKNAYFKKKSNSF